MGRNGACGIGSGWRSAAGDAMEHIGMEEGGIPQKGMQWSMWEWNRAISSKRRRNGACGNGTGWHTAERDAMGHVGMEEGYIQENVMQWSM